MEHDGEEAIVVTAYMVAPVHTIHESERLSTAERRMSELGISALPMIDDTGQLGGVITENDLLRLGRIRGSGRERTLELPDHRLREHASGPLEIVAPSATVAEAAHRMVRRRVHHVFVAQSRIAAGVVTTRELMRAVSELRIERTMGELVERRTVVSIQSTDPLGVAIDSLITTDEPALVVLESGWPVGLFDQRETLAAKDASARAPVDEWMTTSFVCASPDLPAHRAAARAAETGARAIFVTHGPEVLGIVTGTDFASLLAA